MRKSTVALLTSALLATSTSISLAAEPAGLVNDHSPTVTATPLGDESFRIVSYRDLNLSSDADAKVLASRIRRAVEIVCESHNSKNIMRIRECRDEALADAKLQVLTQTAVSLASADRMAAK